MVLVARKVNQIYLKFFFKGKFSKEGKKEESWLQEDAGSRDGLTFYFTLYFYHKIIYDHYKENLNITKMYSKV